MSREDQNFTEAKPRLFNSLDKASKTYKAFRTKI